MKINYFLLMALFSLNFLVAEQEIIVRLSTESELLPLYITPIEQDDKALDNAYLKALRDILSFDCNYNGMTKVIPKNQKIAELKEIDQFAKPIDFAKLSSAKILYLLKLRMQERKLTCKVCAVSNQSIKQIEGINMSGNLAKDRVVIHQLADTIFKLLFQKSGISCSKILFTKNGQKTSELVETDYDGANGRSVLSDTASIVTPAYQVPATGDLSPAFCYVSYKTGQSKIFYVSKKDGKARRLTPLRGNQMTPAISKDARFIAFSCDAAGTTDLFLQPFHPETGAIGKPRQIYTSRVSAQASPTFSPDGKQMAFVSGKDGIPKIYLMDIPKENALLKEIKPQLISKKCRENSAPVWSPDGTKIAYSARSSGARQLWIYDVEKKEERQLTDGPGDKENAAWAPNSLHLLFNQGGEIYLVNLNQKEAVRVSSGFGEKRFPVWK